MSVLSRLRSCGVSDDYTVPVLASLLLHGLAIVAMVVVWPDRVDRQVRLVPAHIMAKAYVPAPEPVAPEPEPERNEPVAKPEQKPEGKKPVEAPKKEVPEKKVPVKPVKTDPGRQAVREEQQRRKRELEKQRKAEAARKAKEARRLREQERLAALERDQIEQQRLAEQQETDAGVVGGYVALLERVVRQNWNRPPSARQGMTTRLRVRLTPTGEIISIEISKSSGSSAFDDSAVLAVQRAAPFRELLQLENRLFESYFREFDFFFDPQDLLE